MSRKQRKKTSSMSLSSPPSTLVLSTEPEPEPTVTDAAAEPVVNEVSTEPVVSTASTEPVTTDVAAEPVTADVAAEPVTTEPVFLSESQAISEEAVRTLADSSKRFVDPFADASGVILSDQPLVPPGEESDIETLAPEVHASPPTSTDPVEAPAAAPSLYLALYPTGDYAFVSASSPEQAASLLTEMGVATLLENVSLAPAGFGIFCTLDLTPDAEGDPAPSFAVRAQSRSLLTKLLEHLEEQHKIGDA